MALIVKDRVQETSTTTGTGTFTLDGANSGFATFSSAVGNGNTTYYAIVGGTEWEVGIGTVGAGTLARTTLLASSTGSAISFSAGIKNVFCTYPAGKSVTIDDIQTLTNKTINLASNTLTGTTAQFNTALSDGDFATLAGTETLTNKALNGTLGATTPSTVVATTATANSFIPNLSTVPTNGLYLPATNSIGFSTNSTERMRINASGNLGIGVTPSAWASAAYSGVLQMSNGTSLSSYVGGINPIMQLGTNNYYDATLGDTYVVTAQAAKYSQDQGTHKWYIAPSGTAGNAITFTQAMTLDASGNLGIGTASPTQKLDVVASGAATAIRVATTSSHAAFLEASSNNATVRTRLQANTTEAFTGTLSNHPFFFQTNGTERIRIDANGKLGIATSTPTGNLSVVTTSSAGSSIGSWNSSYAVVSPNAGSAAGAGLGLAYNTSADAAEIAAIAPGVAWKPLYLYSGGLFFNSANGGSTGSLNTAGNLTITGATATKASGTTWANPSDIRLKDNVTDYSKGLAELMQVNVKEWVYNGKGGTTKGMKGLGVIADDVMTVLPNTVDNYQAKLNTEDEAETDIKKFDATEITWLMLNAIKELKAIVDIQAEQIKLLQGN
jgi:hypothetical protein